MRISEDLIDLSLKIDIDVGEPFNVTHNLINFQSVPSDVFFSFFFFPVVFCWWNQILISLEINFFCFNLKSYIPFVKLLWLNHYYKVWKTFFFSYDRQFTDGSFSCEFASFVCEKVVITATNLNLCNTSNESIKFFSFQLNSRWMCYGNVKSRILWNGN